MENLKNDNDYDDSTTTRESDSSDHYTDDDLLPTEVITDFEAYYNTALLLYTVYISNVYYTSMLFTCTELHC